MPRRLQLKQYTLHQPRSRNIKPPQRLSVSKLPARKRKECERLASIVEQWLLRKKDDPIFSEEELRELGAAMELPAHKAFDYLLQAQRYKEGYPDQPLANAFAPRALKNDPQRKSQPNPDAEVPRRRPPIMVVEEPKRSHIIAYAAQVEQLLSYKDRDGTVPGSIVAEVAAAFSYTRRKIRNDVVHLAKYKATYGQVSAADAFTPLPMGRIRGHNVPSEILDDIRNARINTSWLSLNRDQLSYVPITQHISGKLLHDLILQLHPEYNISLSTMYRILQKIDGCDAVNMKVARDGPGSLQRHAPWRDNKPTAPGIRIQLDIRPLPTVVDYNGIRCTLLYVAIRDDFSRYRPVYWILPSKRMDSNEEVHRQDFKARQIRQLVALYCLKTGSRPYVIYVDNGSQWSKKSLGPYMQFLVAPGEEPTRLEHRKPGRPRGGGGIERELQLVDEFLKYRPGFIREDDYRRSLKEIGKRTVPKFEEVVKDFAEFHKRWNHDEVGDQPSYFSIWNSNLNQALSMPSLANLAVFALTSRQLSNVVADPEGFKIGEKGKKYEPWDYSDEQYKALTNAALARQALSVLVFEFDDAMAEVDPIVFFSLDPDKIIWYLAVEKAQKGKTERRWAEVLPNLEKSILSENGSIAQLFLQKLLKAQGGPLVIDAFGRERRIVKIQSDSPAASNSGVEGDASAALTLDGTSLDQEEQFLLLAQKTKVENSSLEAAGVLNKKQIDSSTPSERKKRKKVPSNTSSKPHQAGEMSHDREKSSGSDILISDEELAGLIAADQELTRRLERKKQGD